MVFQLLKNRFVRYVLVAVLLSCMLAFGSELADSSRKKKRARKSEHANRKILRTFLFLRGGSWSNV